MTNIAQQRRGLLEAIVQNCLTQWQRLYIGSRAVDYVRHRASRGGILANAQEELDEARAIAVCVSNMDRLASHLPVGSLAAALLSAWRDSDPADASTRMLNTWLEFGEANEPAQT